MYTDGDEEERKWTELVERWVDFRLSVSGGAESSMGRIGCGTVDGFLNEIDWFDDMGCDWGGAYRGEFRYENRDGLFKLLDESSLDKELINLIKEHTKTYLSPSLNKEYRPNPCVYRKIQVPFIHRSTASNGEGSIADGS